MLVLKRRSRASGVMLFAALLTGMACATPKRTIVQPAEPVAAQHAGRAEELLRAGCHDCLVEAADTYQRLRDIPGSRNAGAAGAVQAAVLLGLRERELGLEESDAFPRARALLAADPALHASWSPLVDIADRLPDRASRYRVGDDAALERVQLGFKQRDASREHLSSRVNESALAAYLALSYACAYEPGSETARTQWLDAMPAWRDAPLLLFKLATCGEADPEVLAGLLDTEPRFREVDYFLALRAILAGSFDEAGAAFERAYAWRTRWPTVTNAMANAALTLEDFETAVEFFDRTLAVAPRFPDALLGKARAQTYLGRPAAAIATVDALLALDGWLVGDARYWRAFNEEQLDLYDAAWADVEHAATLLMNAEVPKLAGVIAFRRDQLQVAQSKFEESRARNPADCDTLFYLGLVLAAQRSWSPAAEGLRNADTCLSAAARGLTKEIEALRSSTDPPDRIARQIAGRERRLASLGRQHATSWFNLAIASFNLARPDDARAFAERLADDPQFGERARQLLARVREQQ